MSTVGLEEEFPVKFNDIPDYLISCRLAGREEQVCIEAVEWNKRWVILEIRNPPKQTLEELLKARKKFIKKRFLPYIERLGGKINFVCCSSEEVYPTQQLNLKVEDLDENTWKKGNVFSRIFLYVTLVTSQSKEFNVLLPYYSWLETLATLIKTQSTHNSEIPIIFLNRKYYDDFPTRSKQAQYLDSYLQKFYPFPRVKVIITEQDIEYIIETRAIDAFPDYDFGEWKIRLQYTLLNNPEKFEHLAVDEEKVVEHLTDLIKGTIDSTKRYLFARRTMELIEMVKKLDSTFPKEYAELKALCNLGFIKRNNNVSPCISLGEYLERRDRILKNYNLL